MSLPEGLDQLFRHALFLPEQASAYAVRVDHLHYLEMALLTGVTMTIAAAGGVFAWRYRRSRHPQGQAVRPPRAVEFGVYAVLLAVFVLLWVVGFRQYASLDQAPRDALDVYVTGKQWMWKFGYADGSSSAGALVVPAGRPVRLLLTSRDVIHSFFVPALRIKRDAVPGLYTSVWFAARRPGRYPILCTEFCGSGHSDMRAEVVVLAPDAYDAWRHDPDRVATRAEGATDLAALGMQAAVEAGCLGCHTATGLQVVAPSWKGLFGSTVQLQDGSRVVADEAYLTRSMMDPTVEIVAGFAPIMPSYQGQLDPPRVAAIVEYIKSLAEPGKETADGR